MENMCFLSFGKCAAIQRNYKTGNIVMHEVAWIFYFSISNEPSFPSNNILKQRRITERNCINKHFTIVLIY